VTLPLDSGDIAPSDSSSQVWVNRQPPANAFAEVDEPAVIAEVSLSEEPRK
jgi:hypothetical protein